MTPAIPPDARTGYDHGPLVFEMLQVGVGYWAEVQP